MNALQKALGYLPLRGIFFDRPIVMFQSDDWGLVGVSDRAGWDELCAHGIPLGRDPYDFHSLETAEDLDALYDVLRRHRDALGRHPSMVFNFIVANVDFERARAEDYQNVPLLPLSQGLPGQWERPGLFEAYRRGIADGLIHPELHGLTHFCLKAAERTLKNGGERAERLKKLYRAETPLLYGHMRWLGYEYRDDTGDGVETWLGRAEQRVLIQRACKEFLALFGIEPGSACAPGYRANADTHGAWAEAGVQVAQNGPGTETAPHGDRNELLMLYRNVSLEPAVDGTRFGVTPALVAAETMIRQGKPVVVSTHAVNFHSTLRDNRSVTLEHLDRFLSELEQRYPTLVYSFDEELHRLVEDGYIHVGPNAHAVPYRERWQSSVSWAYRRRRMGMPNGTGALQERPD